MEIYNFKERFSERQTLKGEINGIFIDCMRYDFPRVSPGNLVDGIRLMSIPDLLAMKERLKQMVNNPDKIFETLPVEISTGVEKEHKKTEGYHK